MGELANPTEKKSDPLVPEWAAMHPAWARLEGVQHMNQYSSLWVTSRATAERLKDEKFLFLSGAGPYKGQTEPERLIALAERVEEHVSTEHANWFNETRRAAAVQKKEGA